MANPGIDSDGIVSFLRRYIMLDKIFKEVGVEEYFIMLGSVLMGNDCRVSLIKTMSAC